MGEESFFAFDRIGENAFLFQTLISKEDLVRCIEQAPAEQREEIKTILKEMFDLLAQNSRNMNKVKKLRDDLNERPRSKLRGII